MHARLENGRQAEKDQLQQDAHRVRADALRDADGRHQIQTLEAEGSLI